MPITIIEDNIVEGAEKIKLKLVYDCDCIDPVLSEIIIDEVDDFTANFTEISACTNQSFSITPEIIGGVSPYNFLWETGVEIDTLEVNITEPTQYSVTITDFCANSIVAIADIDIQNIPRATLVGTYDFCEIATTGIPVLLEGNPPWRIEYNIDDVSQIPLENIQISPVYLNTPTEGNYIITTFSDANCIGNIINDAVVESPFDIATEIVSPSCFNSADGIIEITQLEAISPFSIEWNVATDDDYFLNNLSEGIYILNITDGDNCLYEKVFDLSAISYDINECIPVYIPNSFSPNDDGFNDVFSIFFDDASDIENIISLQIYNRWGGLMFEQTNFIPNNGATNWKGDYQGKPLNTGVYVYKVLLAFANGKTLLVSGDVNLMR